jgi:hypothetical protein
VPFVNLDNLTLIGTGSEWFWTALSGVVLAITFIAIYRQLRLARSQGAIAQLDGFTREWNSERYLLHRREVLVALRTASDPAVLPEGAISTIGNYWEGIAALARAGHLDRRLIWTQYGNTCQAWWRLLTPYTKVVRERDNDPTVYEELEWLVGVLDGYDRQIGAGPPPDPASWRERTIRSIDGQLAVERSLREVYVVPGTEMAPARRQRPTSSPNPAP